MPNNQSDFNVSFPERVASPSLLFSWDEKGVSRWDLCKKICLDEVSCLGLIVLKLG